MKSLLTRQISSKLAFLDPQPTRRSVDNVEASKTMSGWLLKRSHNKFNILMQRRFVRLVQDELTKFYHMEYSKSESDEPEKRISMLEVDWVRPFDTTENCKKFEMMWNGRVFLFEAANFAEMTIWITSMQIVMQDCKAEKLQEELGLVQRFDNDGESSYKAFIRKEVSGWLLPASPGTSLAQLVGLMQCLSDYLTNAIEAKIAKTKRYDVLRASVDAVIYVLTSRLQPALEEDSSPYLSAKLGDLHSLIAAITRFQSQLTDLYYGVDGVRHQHFALADELPRICDRYVNGTSSVDRASSGYFEGAVHHLIANCTTIVNRFLAQPGACIDRHENGSLYTALPVELWLLLHQHLNLADETDCAVLQLLIADKVRAALSRMTAIFAEFITGPMIDQSSTEESGPGAELELLCALANDIVIHIEEMCQAVERFDGSPELRLQVNAVFDAAVLELMCLGRQCMQRLERTVMSDLSPHLDQVMTVAWLTGNQTEVAVATLRDYFDDLSRYLLPFWLDRLAAQLLESVVLRYARGALLWNRPAPSRSSRPRISSFDSANGDEGRNSMSATSKITVASLANHVRSVAVSWGVRPANETERAPVEPETLARLGQDANSLHTFFSLFVDSAQVLDTLALLGEAVLYLNSAPSIVTCHVILRVFEYPFAAKAIHETAMACLLLRGDLAASVIEDYLEGVGPALEMANLAQKTGEEVNEGMPPNKSNSHTEGLGHMYLSLLTSRGDSLAPTYTEKDLAADSGELFESDVVSVGRSSDCSYSKDELATDASSDCTRPGSALSRNISFARSISRGNISSSNTPKKSGSGKKESRLRRFSSLMAAPAKGQQEGLVTQALGIVQLQAQASIRNISEKKTLAEQREREQQHLQQHLLSFESWLDKRSPKNILLWQKRWFKLISKPRTDAGPTECPFTYTLVWSKKPGGSALKSAEATDIDSFCLLEAPRPLVFNSTRRTVMLASQLSKEHEEDSVVEVNPREPNTSTPINVSISQYYVLVLTMAASVQRGGENKEHVLRCTNVDKLIQWVNCLSRACGVAYDAGTREWNQAALNSLEQEAVSREAYLNEKKRNAERVRRWFQKRTEEGERDQSM